MDFGFDISVGTKTRVPASGVSATVGATPASVPRTLAPLLHGQLRKTPHSGRAETRNEILGDHR